MAVEIDKNVSAHLPGTWGTPRSVRLERIPGQSLGISIVGKSNQGFLACSKKPYDAIKIVFTAIKTGICAGSRFAYY